MYYAHVASGAVPGDELYTADSEQGVGKVVDAQPAPGGGYELLAVVQIASLQGDEVHLGSAQGPILEFRGLPYPFAVENNRSI